MATLREHGKKEWTSGGCIDQIKTGALQRIADACELMATNYQSLIEDRDLYRKWWKENESKNETLRRSNRALRAYLKRMKEQS